MSARDFSRAGIVPARLARGVSFVDGDNAEKEIWSAFFFGALPAITGTGAVTLADTTSSGAGTPVVTGSGAVTLGALTSAGSGSSGATVAASATRVPAPRRRGGVVGRGLFNGRRI
jgi:hypothetical protein